MPWSWDEPLDEDDPPEDYGRRPLESRLDALGPRGTILLVVLALMPLVPLAEVAYRSLAAWHTYSAQASSGPPYTWPLAPVGMLGGGCLLCWAAWRAGRSHWRIWLSFFEGVFLLPRVFFSLLPPVPGF